MSDPNGGEKVRARNMFGHASCYDVMCSIYMQCPSKSKPLMCTAIRTKGKAQSPRYSMPIVIAEYKCSSSQPRNAMKSPENPRVVKMQHACMQDVVIV